MVTLSEPAEATVLDFDMAVELPGEGTEHREEPLD